MISSIGLVGCACTAPGTPGRVLYRRRSLPSVPWCPPLSATVRRGCIGDATLERHDFGRSGSRSRRAGGVAPAPHTSCRCRGRPSLEAPNCAQCHVSDAASWLLTHLVPGAGHPLPGAQRAARRRRLVAVAVVWPVALLEALKSPWIGQEGNDVSTPGGVPGVPERRVRDHQPPCRG